MMFYMAHTCQEDLLVSANMPTQLKNPDKKELKGKVPTMAQYRNGIMIDELMGVSW